MDIEPRRGGYRKKFSVWEAVRDALLAKGEATMVDLHREYKERLREAYAEEWRLFEGGRRPYRVVRGKRFYLRHPPRGMTYLSFARYVNRFVNEGKLEKVIVSGEVKTSDERFVSDDLIGVIKSPVFYRLR